MCLGVWRFYVDLIVSPTARVSIQNCCTDIASSLLLTANWCMERGPKTEQQYNRISWYKDFFVTGLGCKLL